MNYEELRRSMVDRQLRGRGIKDERVLRAMGMVERHLFLEKSLWDKAYDDCALPIGEGQTISQPYMVAIMTELLELRGDERVLEIGSGSGYQGAVLSLLAREVFTVERIESLALRAREAFKRLKYDNIHLIIGDGTLGLPGKILFDGIIVTAAAPRVPRAYVDQLQPRGRLVIPVGSRFSQTLYQIRKTPSGTDEYSSTPCVFVPLIGKDGWENTDHPAESC